MARRTCVATNRDVREMELVALSSGWYTEVTGGGHVAFITPEGRKIFAPMTPGDYRGIRNLRAKLRRAGLGV